MLEARGGIEPANKGFADLHHAPATILESIRNLGEPNPRPVSVRSPTANAMKIGEPFNPWRGSCGFYAPDVVSRLGPVVILGTRRKLSHGHKCLYILLVRRWGPALRSEPTELFSSSDW